MTTVSTKSGRIIKVVSREEEKSTLTESDNEMDERAVEAVKAAINKAKICKKPIAGYDEKRNKLTLNMQMGKESMQSRKPMILVLAGPNGSGKSTITAFPIYGLFLFSKR